MSNRAQLGSLRIIPRDADDDDGDANVNVAYNSLLTGVDSSKCFFISASNGFFGVSCLSSRNTLKSGLWVAVVGEHTEVDTLDSLVEEVSDPEHVGVK